MATPILQGPVRDDFLAVVFHELKTPLTSVKVQIHLLQKMLSDEAFSAHPQANKFEKLLQRSESQLDSFVDLMHDFLKAARISDSKFSLSRQEVELSRVIRKAVECCKTQHNGEHSVVRVDMPSDIRGFWDPMRIEEILINLLSNAVKYSAGSPVEIKAELDEQRVRLTVRDHGVGIAKEDQDRIFSRFERINPSQNPCGFGLGLFITRHLVEAHGGSIRVESALGQGAAFIVELPLTV